MLEQGSFNVIAVHHMRMLHWF